MGLKYDRVKASGTLLFDEIEKTYERVLDLFLQLLSAARITLGSGRVLNLEKFYVAATSNIGSPLLIGSKTIDLACQPDPAKCLGTNWYCPQCQSHAIRYVVSQEGFHMLRQIIESVIELGCTWSIACPEPT